METKEIFILVNKENRITMEYYILDEDTNIIRKDIEFVAEDFVSTLVEIYDTYVIKGKVDISKVTLYVKYPHLYFTEIYELGKAINALILENNTVDKLQVFPVMMGDD